jgi:predicted alpha/beta superfamily hydrolase
MMFSTRIRRAFEAGLVVAAAWFTAAVQASPPTAPEAIASHAPRVTDTGMLLPPSRLMRYKGAKWDYEVRVALPRSYVTSNKSYPVLWVLDGQWMFDRAVSVSSSSMGGIPEMIVVSIGSPPDHQDEVEKRRIYDFTLTPGDVCSWSGHAAISYRQECEGWRTIIRTMGALAPTNGGGARDFLNFLIDDVRPEITRAYRTNDSNTLWGFSGGGSFCGIALLTRPEAFDRYICASSAWYLDDRALFQVEEHYAATHKDLKAQVVFTMGDGEIMDHNFPGIGSGTLLMAETLRLRHYPSLDLQTRIIAGGSHDGYGMDSSLYFGLKTLFGQATPTKP